MFNWKLRLLVIVLPLMQACGGGSGGGSDGNTPPQPPPVDNSVSFNEASRFAARATFGLNSAAIENVAAMGPRAWLESQYSLSPGLHKPVVADLLARQANGEFAEIETEIEDFHFLFQRMALWQQTINSPDVLRQRIAFALSEIFVVSDRVDALIIDPQSLSGYYDMLLIHAFGNFRDLLEAVTRHPAMGIYLSHVNNSKADPGRNIFPDENYAREVMQLFTIGLFELNRDGSLRRDGLNRPIPTYSNTEIREFAKVFTGLSYGGAGARFPNPIPNFSQPMQMFDAFHEPGEKRLLNGLVVTAGQSGDEDIAAALDNLFNHPNVGPFIGRQLIQRLVTSNPSPDYIARVAAVFNGDETGVRGDMKALIEAILLDPEATSAVDERGTFGKLREPILRYTALLRQFNVRSPDGFFANLGYLAQGLTNQHPLSAPSVFNFFLPAHTPPGEIADAGLVAPEFQITTSSTIVGISNLVDLVLLIGQVNDLPRAPFSSASLDLDEYLAVAEDISALIERLDGLMTYGTLSEATKAVIRDVLVLSDDLEFRVKIAIYLIFTSPEYAIQL